MGADAALSVLDCFLHDVTPWMSDKEKGIGTQLRMRPVQGAPGLGLEC